MFQTGKRTLGRYMVLLNSRTVNVATFHAARDTNPWYGMLKPYFSILMNRLNGKICVSEPAKTHMMQYLSLIHI